jgi:hypothetical protein
MNRFHAKRKSYCVNHSNQNISIVSTHDYLDVSRRLREIGDEFEEEKFISPNLTLVVDYYFDAIVMLGVVEHENDLNYILIEMRFRSDQKSDLQNNELERM